MASFAARFKRDVWDEPTIRPVAAVLLTALAAIIVWLTAQYGDPHSAQTITDTGAWVTIGVMITAIVVVAIEPTAIRWANARQLSPEWEERQRRWARLPGSTRFMLRIAGAFSFALVKVPSVAWSLADFMLVRVIAVASGVTLPGWGWRYLSALALFALVLWAGLTAPPTLGLGFILYGILAIIAIVRRWTWIESDRDTFLLERGERDEITGHKPSDEQFRSERARAIACLVVLSLAVAAAWIFRDALPATFITVAAIAVACVCIFAWLHANYALTHNRWLDPGASAFRIKFKEDLRDEAMVALLALFILIPLALDRVFLVASAGGAPPFDLGDGIALPATLGERFGLWFEYFGSELAKTVPFVDWSEVFDVSTDSPIEPTTRIGSQTAFVMRAGLDLLFLAAVVQAIDIAGRLREQKAAFRSNRLPILEPFTEAPVFAHAGHTIDETLDILPTEQPAIAAFPAYDSAPLQSLIQNTDGKLNHIANADHRRLVQKAAVAVLARQHKSDQTDLFLFNRAKEETDPELKRWIADVASGVAPDRRAHSASDLPLLIMRLSDPIASAGMRAAAARRLGRLGDVLAVSALKTQSKTLTPSNLGVAADAAVALVKLDAADTDLPQRLRDLRDAISAACDALAQRRAQEWQSQPAHLKTTQPRSWLSNEDIMPALATAYAMKRLGTATDAQGFSTLLQHQVQSALRIGIEPMTVAAPQALNSDTAQMVRIEPGAPGFDANLVIGYDFVSRKLGDREDQTPRKTLPMSGSYCIGRTPVTNREFNDFLRAHGQAEVDEAEKRDRPVIDVDWHDANAYAGWLERITGERYRLPTEAEWEYACRAGTTTKYFWGDAWEDKRAPTRLRPVGGDVANPWGLHDLYGHVYEWCIDPWHKSHEKRSDAEAWLTDIDLEKGRVRRVVRAGSWSFPPPENRAEGELRSSYRNSQVPTHKQTNFGFRLARSL